MPEFFAIKASDLVLKVSEKVNPAKFNISKYETFLDVLYFEREFEKSNKKFGITQRITQVLRYVPFGHLPFGTLASPRRKPWGR